MSAVRVKVCGITRLEDALLAVRLGADALGFNFWPRSKRYLAPAAAREIVRRLPPLVASVGVFVDPTRDEVLRAAEASGIGIVQLHGDEPPGLCAALPLPVLKAIRVRDAASLEAIGAYAPVAGILLDTASPGYGGSGATFDWTLAASAAAARPLVLAGGLGPENVADAVRIVRPFAVDVASGVESVPGVKDEQRMRRFIEAAKEAT